MLKFLLSLLIPLRKGWIEYDTAETELFDSMTSGSFLKGQ